MPRILTQAHVNDFRNRLCDIAAGLYSDVGHNGFNMRDLAARLGVSAMTPYRYFRDKSEILAAVRTRSFTRLVERLEAAAGGTAPASAAVLEAYAGFALEGPANYRLMFDLSQPPEAFPDLERAQARARATFIATVSAAAGSDAAGIAWVALHGALALHLAGKLTLEELNHMLTRMARLVLNLDHAFDLVSDSRSRPENERLSAAFSPMMSAAE